MRDSGNVVGCVEMGIVRIGRMASARAGDAIQQWEQSISTANLGDGDSGTTMEVNRDATDTASEVFIEKDSAPYIGNLAVSQEFRRRGVASALVLESCKWARTMWAAQCVWLHVEETNEAAKRLYQKLKFGCEVREPVLCDEFGRRRRFFLRSEGGTQDWTQAPLLAVRMNVWEYLRWCWQDLKRTREANERL